jgi:lysyl-tRNA synthetase class II
MLLMTLNCVIECVCRFNCNQQKDTFIKTNKLFNAMRTFFNDAGYLEVETPVLQPIPGGSCAALHHTQLIRHSALYANS